MHTHSVKSVSLGVLLLKRCRDEEGVCLGVFVLPNLNADLWDSKTNLIQEPQHSVVIYCIWRENILLYFKFDSEYEHLCFFVSLSLIPQVCAGMFAKGMKFAAALRG